MNKSFDSALLFLFAMNFRTSNSKVTLKIQNIILPTQNDSLYMVLYRNVSNITILFLFNESLKEDTRLSKANWKMDEFHRIESYIALIISDRNWCKATQDFFFASLLRFFSPFAYLTLSLYTGNNLGSIFQRSLQEKWLPISVTYKLHIHYMIWKLFYKKKHSYLFLYQEIDQSHV